MVYCSWSQECRTPSVTATWVQGPAPCHHLLPHKVEVSRQIGWGAQEWNSHTWFWDLVCQMTVLLLCQMLTTTHGFFFFFWDLFESQSVIPADSHTETDWWLIICRFTLQMSAIARTKTGQSQELEIHLGFLAGCRNWDTQTFICHLLDQLRAMQPRLRPDAPVWDVGIAIPTLVDLSKSTF